jgi:hypothetical protein
MNFVQRNWEDYHGRLLRQGLDEQLPPKQGGVDRRGFEWFFWQRKMSSGHIVAWRSAQTASGSLQPVMTVR